MYKLKVKPDVLVNCAIKKSPVDTGEIQNPKPLNAIKVKISFDIPKRLWQKNFISNN